MALRLFRFPCPLKLTVLSLVSLFLVAKPETHITDVTRLREMRRPSADSLTVRGIVTAFSGWKNSFFVQDSTGGISVDRLESTLVAPGDEVVIQGTVQPGRFAPLLLSKHITVIGKAALPRPLKPTYEEVAAGKFDSRWIELHGVVHSARVETVWERQILLLGLRVAGGSVTVHLLDYQGMEAGALIDSVITVRGVCATNFNDRKQIVGLRLFVPGADHLTIDEPRAALASLPVSQIAELQRFAGAMAAERRVKVTGTLVYQSVEHGLYLEQEGEAIHLQTKQVGGLRLGDRLEAVGFVRNFGYSAGLEDAQVRRLGNGAEVRPLAVAPENVISTRDGFRATPYDGRLVKMSATVVEQIPSSHHQVWLLQSGHVLFEADLSGATLAERANFEPESTVSVIGICVAEIDDSGTPVAFRLLLRSPADVSLSKSPFRTKSLFILGVALLLILGGGLLARVFERQYLVEGKSTFSPQKSEELAARFRFFGGILSWAVFCLAMASLMWAPFDGVPAANRWEGGAVEGTLLLAALAVFWGRAASGWQGKAAQAAALLLALLGASALLKTANLFPLASLQPLGGALHAIGASSAVAFCLGVLGMSLLLGRLRRFGATAQFLLIGVGAIALLNIFSQLYGEQSSAGIARHTGMPWPIALCFFSLSTAALLASCECGLMNTVCSPGLGGLLTRKLLPLSLFIPVLCGWLALQGEWLGYYDSLYRLALLVLSCVLSFGCVISVSAAVLNRLDQARSKTEQALRERDKYVEARSAELAESERLYLFLVEGVKDYAIFLLDASGGVKSWNNGAEQLTGYGSAEIVGRSFQAFYDAADLTADAPDRSLALAIADGRVCQEGWRVRKDGSKFWASTVTTRLLDEEGRLRGFSMIIRDMTEQRHAESLLVAERLRAEHANEAKSNFLASMSHEIRTPMNSILGMADLLAETDLDALQREYVERFQRAGSNLLTIINDLLDLSKIESGHFDLEEVAFDVEEVAQRALDLVLPPTRGNPVTRALRIAPELKTSVIGDANRLQQILLNLLGNARKFTERGEIVLNVAPHPDGAAGHMQFQVSDTGIGIAQEELSSIFEDFTQSESTISRRFGGTGLGLGIARRLVQRMGGSLTVESQLGVGSTFTFDAFFRAGRETPAGEPSAARAEDLRHRRILIVDSSSANRLIYRELCSAWGMRPQETAAASEAISLIEQSLQGGEPFVMVLLDRFSTDLNAFEAIEEIRELSPDLPVVLTTNEDFPGDATRAKSLGFADYSVKPIRRGSLLRLVSAAMRQGADAANAKERRMQAAKTAQEKKPTLKVLAAEDSEDNRFLIEAYLKGSPYQLVFATNGERALEEFQAQSFDLVLMDVQMPIMDGLRATREIREVERRQGRTPIPIIALTANAMAVDVESSKAAGCDAHLAKPISKTDLLKALGEWQAERVG